jgi:hypothetical protein
MKSRLSLKNSVKAGLSLVLASILICGCTSSTKPTYSKEDVASSLENICKKEYKIEVKARLVGRTLWVYIPVEDLFTKADKPEKYMERFSVEDSKVAFERGILKLAYQIKSIPEREKAQQVKYNKDVSDKINSVWRALRRVVFSMKHSGEDAVRFYGIVIADIKNGFETIEIFYGQDLKKVSYEYISWGEYQHRTIEDTNVSPLIIQDKNGGHLDYRDISMEEFICGQIENRIRMKFQKPEVGINADIDKEILRIAINTLSIYQIQNFSVLELNNLLTQNRIILNKAAVLGRPID